MLSKYRTILSLCLLAGMCLPNAASAQTPADIAAAQRQAEIIQRQEQERQRFEQEEARRRAERVDGMDTRALQPKIEVPAIGAPCREIYSITINGASKLPAAVRRRITDEFSGRCLNVGDIERILAEITKDYIDRGFITTRAYLPPQDLSTGRLEILVIEGVVEKIIIDDGNARSISIGNVFPGVEQGILDLRELEQGIDQINRLASNNAQLDIQPGEKPGTSTVVIHNKPQSPFHFNLSTDNQGSESTGRNQTGATVGADNLLGFNEFFSITHRESTPGDPGSKYSASDNSSFSVPFGYWTLSLGNSRSRYVSTIAVPSGLELVSSGNSTTNNMRLDRTVYRDQSIRALLAATITAKQTKNYLGDQFLAVSSRDLTVLDVDGNLSVGFMGGALSLDLGYAQGLDAMGALRDPANLPDWAPRAQFSKYKAGFNYSLPFRLFDKDAAFTSQLTGQRANHTLYGSEQISIGGIYSVRGFVRNTLTGDHGYYWRNELSMRQPLVIAGENISTRIYIGYDTGEVRNRAAGVPEGRLSGMAVGISANLRGLSWDFFNTRPLTLPGTMNKEFSQTWFRLACSF
jgi:hemolysin activation/secretion protein